MYFLWANIIILSSYTNMKIREQRMLLQHSKGCVLPSYKDNSVKLPWSHTCFSLAKGSLSQLWFYSSVWSSAPNISYSSWSLLGIESAKIGEGCLRRCLLLDNRLSTSINVTRVMWIASQSCDAGLTLFFNHHIIVSMPERGGIHGIRLLLSF